MAKHTVVLEQCAAETANAEIAGKIAGMLGRLPGLEDRLRASRRIFIKINLAPGAPRLYSGRAIEYVDPGVLDGLAAYLRARTAAEILVGDGTDGVGPARAAEEQGHRAVIERHGLRFVDCNQPPFVRFQVPTPLMFRWYDLSAELRGVDLFVSLAKMKSHHLCGITLGTKNLFGLPPNTVYGSPRFALHSPIRLPGILADLAQIVKPDLCLIDGTVGADFTEWGGDPVTSGVLIAGDNVVAADSVAARFMGVDPGARRGTPPFLIADNHLRVCAEAGLGSLASSDIQLVGEMPQWRRPFAVVGASEPDRFAEMEELRRRSAQAALGFFDRRASFVERYLDEVVVLHGDRLLVHHPVDRELAPRLFGALQEAGLSGNEAYAAFMKLVQSEEAELREPYEAAGSAAASGVRA